jgi:hypothetical protein
MTLTAADANIVVAGAATTRTVALATAISTGTVTATSGLYDGANRAYSDSNPPQTLDQTETSGPPVLPATGIATQYVVNGRPFIMNHAGQTLSMTGPQYNVLDWGIVAGNSAVAAANVTAWNALMSAIPDNCEVYFPPGPNQYYFAGTLAIPSGKHLRVGGAGNQKSIITTSATAHIFTVGDWYNEFNGSSSSAPSPVPQARGSTPATTSPSTSTTATSPECGTASCTPAEPTPATSPRSSTATGPPPCTTACASTG